MSDGEDDFMCEEEEDYGLVSFPAEIHRVVISQNISSGSQ